MPATFRRRGADLLSIAALGASLLVFQFAWNWQPAAHAEEEPDCSAYEVALANAQGSEAAAEVNWQSAGEDLEECQAGPGPCTQEAIDEANAEGSYNAAVTNRELAEQDLEACESGCGP